jgi:hypothetical protein
LFHSCWTVACTERFDDEDTEEEDVLVVVVVVVVVTFEIGAVELERAGVEAPEFGVRDFAIVMSVGWLR